LGGEGHNTTVLHHVHAPDAVFAAKFVQRLHGELAKMIFNSGKMF
jgi:hypothetical protein